MFVLFFLCTFILSCYHMFHSHIVFLSYKHSNSIFASHRIFSLSHLALISHNRISPCHIAYSHVFVSSVISTCENRFRFSVTFFIFFPLYAFLICLSLAQTLFSLFIFLYISCLRFYPFLHFICFFYFLYIHKRVFSYVV